MRVVLFTFSSAFHVAATIFKTTKWLPLIQDMNQDWIRKIIGSNNRHQCSQKQ